MFSGFLWFCIFEKLIFFPAVSEIHFANHTFHVLLLLISLYQMPSSFLLCLGYSPFSRISQMLPASRVSFPHPPLSCTNFVAFVLHLTTLPDLGYFHSSYAGSLNILRLHFGSKNIWEMFKQFHP